MSDDLGRVLRKIKVDIRTASPAAFDDIARLAEQYPEEPKVWRTLAHAHEAKGDHSAAIAAVTHAIALDAREPGAFFDRGHYALNAGDYERAVADFSQGLDLHDEPNWAYYYELLHFLRAEAFFKLGKKAEALADLEYVEDSYVFWKGEYWSKAELWALCQERAAGGNGSERHDPEQRSEETVTPESDVERMPESPDEEEAALAKDLGAAGQEVIDTALVESALQYAVKRWRKAAFIVGTAVQRSGIPYSGGDNLIRVFARRLMVLADAGIFRVRGNLHNLRRSEVWLPKYD